MLVLLEKLREPKTKKNSFGLKRLIQKIQAAKYDDASEKVRSARLQLWRKRSLLALSYKLLDEGKMSYKQVVHFERESRQAYETYSALSKVEYEEIGKFYATIRRT